MAFGESMFADAPTIESWKRMGIAEPINAFTALFVSYAALRLKPRTRHGRWVRVYLLLNGVFSAVLHGAMPADDSPWILRFLALADFASMLASVATAYLGALDLSPRWSLIAFWVPALVPSVFGMGLIVNRVEHVADAVFGVGLTGIFLVLLYELKGLKRRQAALCMGISLVALLCQVFDRLPLREGQPLGPVRRFVPLHAVWHVINACLIAPLVGLAEDTKTILDHKRLVRINSRRSSSRSLTRPPSGLTPVASPVQSAGRSKKRYDRTISLASSVMFVDTDSKIDEEDDRYEDDDDDDDVGDDDEVFVVEDERAMRVTPHATPRGGEGVGKTLPSYPNTPERPQRRSVLDALGAGRDDDDEAEAVAGAGADALATV